MKTSPIKTTEYDHDNYAIDFPSNYGGIMYYYRVVSIANCTTANTDFTSRAHKDK